MQPVGAALGSPAARSEPRHACTKPDRKTPYYTRWEASLQRDSAAAGRGAALHRIAWPRSAGGSAINNIPMPVPLDLAHPRHRERDVPQHHVTNPFAGLLPGSTINGATVAASAAAPPVSRIRHVGIEEYNGSDRLQRDERPDAEAIPGWKLDHGAIHALLARGTS